MIGKFRNKNNRGRLITLAIVVAIFLVSATMATMFNYEGNAGAKVAEAASRVDRQVDDTQDAFKDIKELIPEEKRLEAVSPDSYTNHPTSGDNSEFKYASPNASPNDPANVSMPEKDATNYGADTGSDVTYGINPASNGASNAPASAEEKDDQDTAGIAEKIVPPTLTFNDKAREIQGDSVLTQHQEAMDRIVDNWTPQYEAAKREHQELVERINDTRAVWPEYRGEQVALIERQGNDKLREIMYLSMIDDTKAYDRWHSQATDVEMRSAQALSKIEDMNTFIIFYKNQSDFKAITEYDDLDVPLQVGLLLESLDAFETETAGLAEAMKSS